MNRANRFRPLTLAVLSAAALLVAAPPAPARGPTAAEQGSLDWLLLRFAKDREEENKGGGVVDPIVAFRQGESPLEGDGGWKKMMEIIYSPTEKSARKNDAATSIVDRFLLEQDRRQKLEEDKRAPALKELVQARNQIVAYTLGRKGMLGSNGVVLFCVLKIQKGLLPPDWVTWKETDSLKIRAKAAEDIQKKLK